MPRAGARRRGPGARLPPHAVTFAACCPRSTAIGSGSGGPATLTGARSSSGPRTGGCAASWPRRRRSAGSRAPAGGPARTWSGASSPASTPTARRTSGAGRRHGAGGGRGTAGALRAGGPGRVGVVPGDRGGDGLAQRGVAALGWTGHRSGNLGAVERISPAPLLMLVATSGTLRRRTWRLAGYAGAGTEAAGPRPGRPLRLGSAGRPHQGRSPCWYVMHFGDA